MSALAFPEVCVHRNHAFRDPTVPSHATPPTVTAALFQQLDPLLLLLDLHGEVLRNHPCRNARVPEDLRNTRSLRAVLSAPVLASWQRMLHAVGTSGRSTSAIVVFDGQAHACTCIPHDEPDAVWVMLVPGLEHLRPSDTDACLILRHHEWGRLESLSRCQLETLRNVTLGLTNDEIARKICRTKRAVEWHIRFLNQQLGSSGRERLGLIGREAGLHRFGDLAWQQLLGTRPARRSLSESVTNGGWGVRPIRLWHERALAHTSTMWVNVACNPEPRACRLAGFR